MQRQSYKVERAKHSQTQGRDLSRTYPSITRRATKTNSRTQHHKSYRMKLTIQAMIPRSYH